MTKDLQVNKSNRLVEARYRLTLLEQKFILMVVSLINPEDQDFKFFSLSIKDVSQVLGLNSKNAYRDLRKVIISLNKKTLIISKEEKGELIMSWVSSSEYFKDEGRIEFEFSEKLKPYLLQLKRDFTTFKLKNILKLKSLYSIRIYEILKQYEKIGYRKMSLVEFRKMLGLSDDEYPLFANLNQKILKVAEKELKQKTDISFVVETLKEGKSVTHLVFRIIHQNSAELQDSLSNKRKYLIETINDKIEQIFNELAIKTQSAAIKSSTLAEISSKEWNIVDEKHREELIASGIDFIKYVRLKAEYVIKQFEKKKADNPIGMLIDAIKNNYDGIDAYIDESKKENRKKSKERLAELEKQKEDIMTKIAENNSKLCYEIAEKEKDTLKDIIELVRENKSSVIRIPQDKDNLMDIYNESLMTKAYVNLEIMNRFSEKFDEINKNLNMRVLEVNRMIEEVRRDG
ncbi:MAG: replication initiation protein [Candidatus Cloacimonetes bacterium]|nr:replication initiation protein [Candidatus Cloacimonadota bacterium]